jgi:glycosyltransferase involved in cell wall biosynthesis
MRIVFYCAEEAPANFENYLKIGASGTVSAMVLASHGLAMLGHEVFVLNRSESGRFGETAYLRTVSQEQVSDRMHEIGLVDVFIANGFASLIFQNHEVKARKRACWIHNFIDQAPYVNLIKNGSLDYIICISHNQLGTWWRQPIFDRIAQIYNSIDTQAIDGIRKVTKREKKIMFVGAPRSSKGFHDALRIFDAFAKRNSGYKFYVAGSASLHFSASLLSENGIFEKDYENEHLKDFLYLENGDLRDDVVLLGKISREEVLAHLGTSMVAIQNPGWDSEPEVHSISALEAQAMGVPVMSSFRGGQPEAIRPGQTGILLKSRDLESAVRMLEFLTTDSDRAQLMSQDAKRHVRERFQVQMIAKEWDRCLGVMSRGERFSGNFMKALKIKIRHKLKR